MRHKLGNKYGERFRVTATFERWGERNGYKGPVRTLLLKDVRCAQTGELLTDHIWFASALTWERLQLFFGDRVAFDARVTQYIKGYVGRRAERTGEAWTAADYRLSRPTKAEVIERSLVLPRASYGVGRLAE